MQLIIQVLRDLLAPSGAYFPNKVYIIIISKHTIGVLLSVCSLGAQTLSEKLSESDQSLKMVAYILSSKRGL
mgnify:CR=1 FL=1